MDNKKIHWEEVYANKASEMQSWTQERPSPSVDWILASDPDREEAVIDVGGGTSRLVDFLLEAGYQQPAVLDISGAALEQAKARLGSRADLVDWIEADITGFTASRQFGLWHDRAVFHFLTNADDRRLYIGKLKSTLTNGGRVIMATFSPAGPSQCSGLDVMRFDAKALSNELGEEFQLTREAQVEHSTPWGSKQSFQYCEFLFLG